MANEPDPVLVAVEALRTKGIEVTLHRGASKGWKIGDLVYTDEGVMRLALVLAPDEHAGET